MTPNEHRIERIDAARTRATKAVVNSFSNLAEQMLKQGELMWTEPKPKKKWFSWFHKN